MSTNNVIPFPAREQTAEPRLIPNVKVEVTLDDNGKVVFVFPVYTNEFDRLFMLMALPSAAHSEQRKIAQVMLADFVSALDELRP